MCNMVRFSIIASIALAHPPFKQELLETPTLSLYMRNGLIRVPIVSGDKNTLFDYISSRREIYSQYESLIQGITYMKGFENLEFRHILILL